MPTSSYGNSASSLTESPQSGIKVHHNHAKGIDFANFGITKKKELNALIGAEKTQIKGCIAFFKTFAEDKSVDIVARAAANAAVQEDEARLEEYEKNQSSSCSIQ